MNIPYRTRCALKRIGIYLLVLCLVAAAVWVCWILWLGRFVVYTRDGGVKFDFSSQQAQVGQVVIKPQVENPISIYYNEGEGALDTNQELARFTGYYITAKEMEADLPGITKKLKTLPKGTPVMLDVKSIYGNFFYSSAVSDKRNKDIDIEAMDALFQTLKERGLYTIARLPALRDYHYGLNNVNNGLPVAAGYLWMDDYGCYWLNPAKEGTVTYLISIVTELRGLGFREVVFCDYYFPQAQSIVFNGDKSEALAKTAQTLVNTCATGTFTVSFTMDASFTPPTGRSRVYVTDVAAADAAAKADSFQFENPDARVVFLTQVHDTRFDSYSVLRPLADAE